MLDTGFGFQNSALALIGSIMGIYGAIENQDPVAYVNARLTDPQPMAVTHTGGLIDVLGITVFIFFITERKKEEKKWAAS